MQSFANISKLAADRYGGAKTLKQKLTPPKSISSIKKITDDRWLSEMTKCVFQTGFKWHLIEDKWGRFEEVFENFDIERCAMMSDDDLDRLLITEGIVRNYVKIRSVTKNALFLKEVIDTHNSVGNFFLRFTNLNRTRVFIRFRMTASNTLRL